MITGVVKKDILDYLPNSNSTINNQLTMEAILTRDQRTTSHRVLDARSKPQTSAPNSLGVRIENIGKSENVSCAIGGGTSRLSDCSSKTQTSYTKRIRGSAGYPRFTGTSTWLRLGSLLVTLLVASIHGAPTMTPDKPMEPPKKWLNPCGGIIQGFQIDTSDFPVVSEDPVLKIVIQVKNAIMNAVELRNKFVEDRFKITLDELLEQFETQHYDWLPSKKNIPKNLLQPLDRQFLDQVELKSALLNAYEYMQMYAVALEQVVWDQDDQKLPFAEDFKEVEDFLRLVLCELQTGLSENKVKRPDVSRDIMPPEFRAASKSDTVRDVRDWLIFRDYMNGLEYVEQVFQHLLSRTVPKS